MAIVKLYNVTKIIKNNMVLNDVSLEFVPGKIYGLRGKNGCGKTMLMRTICGFVCPTKGKVMIDDKELHKDISFPPSIGALIENPSFLGEYTGRQNLELLGMLNNVSKSDIDEALESVGLMDNADKKYSRYSLGMKQKLGIAFAILGKPDVIVLDEPINALDEESVEIIKNTLLKLRDSGSLIILACHDREELDYLSDYIFIMKNGKIVEV